MVEIKYLSGDGDQFPGTITKNTYGVATLENENETMYINMQTVRFIKEIKEDEKS